MLEGVLENRFRSRVGLHLPDGRYASNSGCHRPVEYHPIDELGVLVGVGDCWDHFDHVLTGVVELEGGLHQGDFQLQVFAFTGAEPAGRLVERVQLHQVLRGSNQVRRGDRIGIDPVLIR
eukprot:5482686-Pleurochrysis_carterae.AAC.1